MTPETPKPPKKRTNKAEAAKAKQAVDKLVDNAKTEQAKVRSAVTKVIMNAESEVKKAIGRPSTYDPIIAHKICEQLSEGVPLREICRQEGYPSYRAIYRWMVQDEELSSHIARAREVGYDNMAEECLDIADNATNDWMDREFRNAHGKIEVERVADTEHIQRSKLRIETRLKLLAKWRPEKYGDKTVITGDPNGAPIKTEETGSGRLFELIRNMEMSKRVTE